MRKVSIVGVGRLGGALALGLAKKGYAVENLVVRKKESAENIAALINPAPKVLMFDDLSNFSAETVFIATQDSEIENAAGGLAAKLQNKPFVFHTSGSLSSEVLHRLKKNGCPTGSIHPLVSVSDARLGVERFAGAYFCVEGERKAVEIAEKIVADLEGKFFTLATPYKTLYHASAVTASGHFVALIDVALEMFSKCGLKESEAQKILLPLIESTVENLQNQTTAQALTGTFARTEVETFERHLETLRREVSAEALEVYLQLAARSTHLAEQRDASREKIGEMQERILLAKKNLKC